MSAVRKKTGASTASRWPVALCIAMFVLLAGRVAAHDDCDDIELPSLSQQAASPIRYVADDGHPQSFYRARLSNVPSGFSVGNRSYAAWCTDYYGLLRLDESTRATLYNSLATLPPLLQSTNWDMVNYVLNNRRGNAFDVQGAIWHFVGGPVPPSDPVFFPQSTATQLMIQDALANGEGFLPTGDQVIAVILDAGTNVQTLVIEVEAPNRRPPVANPDSLSTQRDVPLLVPATVLLANDYDPDGSPFSLIGVSATTTRGGTVVLSGTNILYTPPAGFVGLDAFSYAITDGICGDAAATVTVAVNPPPNRNPIANDDAASTMRNQPLNLNAGQLLANDSDPDGNALVVIGVSANSSAGGTVTRNGTNIVYTPPTGFVGNDTFSYTISDGQGGTATATVTVSVVRGNATPVVMNDTASTMRDQQVVIPGGQLLANDSDPDGDPLVIIGVSTNSARGGVVQFNGTNVVYIPPAGFVGNDTFTYTVSDGQGGAATATVTVSVGRPNAAPVAMNDTATTMRDQQVVIPGGQLLANDSDPDGDPLVIIRVSASSAAGGSVTFNGTNVVYTPPAGFTGTDTFTYTVSDGLGGTATATVTVTVVRPNGAPAVMNDTASTMRDQPVVIPGGQLLANDSDPDGDLLVIIDVSSNSAAGGTVTFNGTNVVYVPPASFMGTDTFTYTVSDGQGGTATATVTVTVVRPNAAPVVVNDVVDTLRDQPVVIPGGQLLANDSDPDGDPLVIIGVSTNSARGGVVVFDGTNVVYIPPAGFIGNDTFTYTVSDGMGGTATATVTVTVGQPNRPPMTGNYTATTPLNTPLNIPLATLLALASDPDGDTIQFGNVTSPTSAGGQAFISGTNVVFIPRTGFVGPDSFRYIVNDGRGLSATGTVMITVVGAPMGVTEEASVFNPQTGLFEQRVTVSNDGLLTIPAFQLCISNLRTNIRVWNATGTTNGTNFIQYNRPLDPGTSVVLRIEYYVPDRRPFTPVLALKTTLPVPPPNANGSAGAPVDRCFMDTRLEGEPRFVIEFASTPGRIYTIIYSDDMTAWKAATPSVTATANRTQWYDDGSPKTDSKPGVKGTRFYRVIQAP